MKKNISINIGGIIFHIEEDGYDQLKEYLESINKYFSTFEDSTEIIADIESRIAEIFLSKLNESKQVITLEDVRNLVATMGSIQDFQAIEEQEGFGPDTVSEEAEKEERKEHKEKTKEERPKKLFRDGKRKLLGGVAAGVAHYFSIDPLWIRLIFIVLIFDVFLTFSISTIIILTYIVLWIVLPESKELEEDKKLKKMYRNPEDRVLGGVASGIAAYFGTDVVIIRLLFVLSIFIGGAGIIAYLILWIILPEATSITDKVQMKGEPVTLSNIESNIKNSLNVKDGEEESTFVKILLFPFRLIAMLINALAKAIGPILLFLAEAARIIIGFIFSIAGVAFIFGIVIIFGALMGIFASGDLIEIDGIPFDLIEHSLPVWGFAALFVAIGIPALGLILLGISIIGKTSTVNPTIGWSLFAIWILSLISLSFLAPGIITDFRADGVHRVESTYNLNGKTAILDIRDAGLEDYHVTTLRLRGHNENEYKLIQEFQSRGRTRRDAIQNAQMIDYNVEFQDSIFYFDSNILFQEDARFRAQKLDMTLYIPYGQQFVMDDDLRNIIYNTIYRYGYRVSDMDRENRWIFTRSGLECITCNQQSNKVDRRKEYQEAFNEAFKMRGYFKEYDFDDFNELEIGGPYIIKILKGDDYRVIIGGNERRIENIEVRKRTDRLEIDEDNDLLDLNNIRKDVEVNIMMPELTTLEIHSASDAKVLGFDGETIDINISGASNAEIDFSAEDVFLKISGASTLKLSGSADELRAELETASKLDAFNFTVRNAWVEASAASVAEIYVTGDLTLMDESLGSEIKYRGNPRVIRKN